MTIIEVLTKCLFIAAVVVVITKIGVDWVLIMIIEPIELIKAIVYELAKVREYHDYLIIYYRQHYQDRYWLNAYGDNRIYQELIKAIVDGLV
jgi:hypothetical protein